MRTAFDEKLLVLIHACALSYSVSHSDESSNEVYGDAPDALKGSCGDG
jgi:hypothetical protein